MATTDFIQFYFIGKATELKPAMLDPDDISIPAVSARPFTVGHQIPLRGALGSGMIYTFPDAGEIRLKELGVVLPDIDGMLESARQKGRNEILDEFNEMSTKEMKKRLKEYSDPEPESEYWYED